MYFMHKPQGYPMASKQVGSVSIDAMPLVAVACVSRWLVREICME